MNRFSIVSLLYGLGFLTVPALRLIEFRGKSGASSHYPNLPAWRAFSKVESPFWANAYNQFPAFLWHRFNEVHLVAKFGFSSRPTEHLLKQSPKAFHFIGSTDCKGWTTILRVNDAGFTKANQFKSWIIPKAARKAFRCFGFKIISAMQAEFVAMNKIAMWE